MVSLPRPARSPLHTGLGTLGAVVATLLGLFVLVYVVLFVTKGRFLKHSFERLASSYADRGVRVGGDFQLYLNPHIKFYAEDLQVDNPAWAHDRQLFTARRIDTEVGIWRLIAGERRIRYLDLDGGRIGAEIDAQGRNTWTFAGDAPFKIPAVDRATVTGTTVHYLDALRKADVRIAVGDIGASQATDAQHDAAAKVAVAGPLTFTGEGTALAAPFTVKGALTTPGETMAGGRVGLTLDAALLKTRVAVSGTLAGLTTLDGADLTMSAKGSDLSVPAKFAGQQAPAKAFSARGRIQPVDAARPAAGSRIALHVDGVGTRADVAGTVRSFKSIAGADVTFHASGPDLSAPMLVFGQKAPALPFRIDGSFRPDGGRSRLALHADAAQTRIDASGLLPQGESIDGSDIALVVAGQNLQSVFKLFGLVAPESRPYRLASHVVKSGKVYNFRDLSGRIGGSDIAGTLEVDVRAKPLLTADLKTKVLQMIDIGPLIGYSPAALDAKGGAAVVKMVAGHPRVIPDAPLAFDELKSVDAHVKYVAGTIVSPTVTFKNLTLGLDLVDRRLTLKPLEFDIIGGRLTAAIDLNARVAPVETAYDIRMSRVPLGQLLTSFDVEKSGTTASVMGRVQLKGYGDTMRQSLASASGRIALIFPAGTLWVRNIELGKLDLQNYISSGLLSKLKKPQEIRCGIVAFTVKDGIAAADPVLFDTKRANFRGLGQFSFKDESLDLSVRGDSKEFSLLSGQSPVGIGGWFAAPAIHPISRQLITRAAVGVGLGVATGGIGALLAFVDIGDAKNVNCQAVGEAKTAAEIDAAPHDPKVKKSRTSAAK